MNKSTGLASSDFARHYFRNLCWFLFLVLLRCFSSDGSPPTPILFNAGWQSIALPGFPIRKSTDLRLFAAPRSLSQLVASFFGSWCQGIPLAPWLAWPFSLKESTQLPWFAPWLPHPFLQKIVLVLKMIKELCRHSKEVFLLVFSYCYSNPSPFSLIIVLP